jgi:phosphohistidine phosphatase SixA
MRPPQELLAASVNQSQAGESMTDGIIELAKNDAKPEASAVATPNAFHSELHNATILLMRHAEKPDPDGPDDPKNPDLSDAGKARAQALADYIPAHFGKPDFLFAAADSDSSARPRETLEPLSAKIGVDIDSSIKNKHFDELAKELDDPKFDGKTIVIAWHHGNIPALAADLGAPKGSYPDHWSGKVFDQILEFHYGADGTPTVQDITEDIKVPGSNGH